MQTFLKKDHIQVHKIRLEKGRKIQFDLARDWHWHLRRDGHWPENLAWTWQHCWICWRRKTFVSTWTRRRVLRWHSAAITNENVSRESWPSIRNSDMWMMASCKSVRRSANVEGAAEVCVRKISGIFLETHSTKKITVWRRKHACIWTSRGTLPGHGKSDGTVPVFLNVYGAQESIPRNEFRQPM